MLEEGSKRLRASRAEAQKKIFCSSRLDMFFLDSKTVVNCCSYLKGGARQSSTNTC